MGHGDKIPSSKLKKMSSVGGAPSASPSFTITITDLDMILNQGERALKELEWIDNFRPTKKKGDRLTARQAKLSALHSHLSALETERSSHKLRFIEYHKDLKSLNDNNVALSLAKTRLQIFQGLPGVAETLGKWEQQLQNFLNNSVILNKDVSEVEEDIAKIEDDIKTVKAKIAELTNHN